MKKRMVSMVLATLMVVNPLFVYAENVVKPEEKASVASGSGEQIFVSLAGSDESGDGTIGKPYKSILKAKDTVSEMVEEGLEEDVYVCLREGDYFLEEPISIGEDDYDDTYRITYQNYNQEEVRIVGGVPVTGWSDDGNGIYKAEIPGEEGFYALFADGKRLQNAKATNWRDKTIDDPSYMQAVYGSSTSWFGEVLKVKSINGSNMSTEYSKGQWSGNLEYLQGAKEYIDEPGEWAIGRGKVYYKPLDGKNPEESEIIAPTVDRIFHLQGTEENPVQNITIDGLKLEMNDFGENLLAHAGRHGGKEVTAEYETNLKGLVDLDNTKNIVVSNCELKNAGYMAVVMNHYSQENTIYGNDIEDNGYAGIFMIGENPGSLNYINKNNTISNNRLKKCGRFVAHGSGIYLMNSGDNTITHNNISDVPRYGISMKGLRYGVLPDNDVNVPFEEHWDYNQTKNNYIAYNTIFDTGRRSGDGGGIEGWGTGRDNWFDNNIIYNAYRGVATNGWRGHSIFMDDGSHHTMVTNNIIYDENAVTVNAGVMMKSISSYVANNVFDVGYAHNGATNIEPYIEPCGSMVFKNNIVYSDASGMLSGNGTWTAGGDGNGDRAFLTFRDVWKESDQVKALDSLAVMDNNLYFNRTGKGVFEIRVEGNVQQRLSLEDWKEFSGNKNKYDANSLEEDPGFIDPDNRDYRLKADSPALTLGTNSIDMSQIGLLSDFRFNESDDTPKTLFLTTVDNSHMATAAAPGQKIQMAVNIRTEQGYLVSDEISKAVFTSSDSNIAVVDENGLVTMVAEGTAVITAEKDGLTDQFTIYISQEEMELIAEDRIDLTMTKNGFSWLDVKVKTATGKYFKPGKVTYKSDNKDIITVDENGFVKALKDGKATVTVQTYVNGKTLSKNIPVYSLPIFSLEEKEKDISLGEMAELTLITNSSNTVLWSSEDESVAEVKDGIIIPMKVGETTITATLDGMELSESCVIRVLNQERISSDQLTAVADSEEGKGNDGPASWAVDGDEGTIWHSAYSGGKTKPNIPGNENNTFTIDLGGTYPICKFEYVPRKDAAANGDILAYELWYSESETEEDFTKLTEGDWEETKNIKAAEFESVKARRIRLRAMKTNGSSKNEFISAAEFYVYKPMEEGRNIAQVDTKIEDIQVAKGTTWAAVKEMLPEQLDITFDNGKKSFVPVEWNEEEYSGSSVTLTGALKCWGGITNSENIKATAEVIVEEADKSALKGKIEEAKKIDLELYTTDSRQVFQKALEEAEEILKDSKASQEEVDDAEANLTLAIEGLEEITEPDTDKSALESKVAEAKKIDLELYTTDSRQVFQKALEEAEEVLEDSNASQKEVDDAEANLALAIEGLEEITEPGKSALESKIAEAEKIDLESYTTESRQVFQKALEEAKKVLEDSKATQKQVDEAEQKLNQAIKGLEKVKEIPVKALNLKTTDMVLVKGKSSTRKATVSPANATLKDITYNSSKTKVATVDKNGKVTAKATGHTTITVSCGSVQESYTVYVKPGKAKITSVKSKKKKTAQVKWKKVSGASGYIVQVSTKSKKTGFKKVKKITNNKTKKYTIEKKIKPGKKAYVRVQAYYKNGKKVVKGPWSKVKSVKIKK